MLINISMKIITAIFLLIVLAVSCKNKQPAVDADNAITSEEFFFKKISQQLDDLHSANSDSFYVMMAKLKDDSVFRKYLDSSSLWDCGEFASSKYKLEIPHP